MEEARVSAMGGVGRMGWRVHAGTRSHRFGDLAWQWGDAGIRERREGLVAAWKRRAE